MDREPDLQPTDFARDIQPREFARVLDHTDLYPDSTEEDLQQVAEEANTYEFYAVCVHPTDVETVDRYLDADRRIATVTGFPLGREHPDTKAETAKYALERGADEVDMVINQRYVLDEEYDDLVAEIETVRDACDDYDALLKVICENCNLPSEEDKRMAYRAADEAGADFIKTATGFGEYGARVEDVQLMGETVRELESDMGIKASGGVGDPETAWEMWQASGKALDPAVFRIGASSGPAIIGK